MTSPDRHRKANAYGISEPFELPDGTHAAALFLDENQASTRIVPDRGRLVRLPAFAIDRFDQETQKTRP